MRRLRSSGVWFAARRSAGSGQHDVIETHAFTSFDNLLEHTSQVGADTVIAYDPDNTITLMNLQMSQLRAADFDFV